MPTRASSPCAWSGTLRSGSLQPLKLTSGAELGFAVDIDVDGLTPSVGVGGAYSLNVTYPVRAHAVLGDNTLPFVFKERTAVVEGHVWMGHANFVSAYELDADRVTAERVFSIGKKSSELLRATRCDALELADDGVTRPTPTGTPATPRTQLELFDAPRGRSIGLSDANGWVAERRGEWARFLAVAPCEVDAWVHAADLDTSEAKVVVMYDTPPDTLRADVVLGKAVPFRTSASATSPVEGDIVEGAELLVAPVVNGFHPVQVAGLVLGGWKRSFLYVAHDDLVGAWKPTAPTSPP